MSCRLVRELRDDGATVLLVTHYADEAERLCDRVALIKAGRLFACGRPADLVTAAERPGGRDRQWTRLTLDDAIVALTTDERGERPLEEAS